MTASIMSSGTVHEDFAVESMAGDILLLGNRPNWYHAGRVHCGSGLASE